MLKSGNHISSVSCCCGCGACVDSCPHQAIRIVENANGYYVPEVDETLCTHCGLCEKQCHIAHPQRITRHALAEEHPFAAWSSRPEIIEKSASGGVFAQLAVDFLSTPDSVVYGAQLTENSRVSHTRIDSVAELEKIQNSKYQQSDASGIYRDVREMLKQAKRVLFSGTPCQIAALYSYLQQEKNLTPYVQENLFTAEILCHGVPTNYLAPLALKVEKAQRILAYRTKSRGWMKGNRTVYQSQVGERVEKQKYRTDFHFRAFLSFSTNRPSCQSCPYARAERVADITMGDFWGRDIHKYNNEAGVSVLLVNSPKGRALVEASTDLITKPTTWREITAQNQNIYMPTNYSALRLSHRIAQIKTWPLWLQRDILQNGTKNRLLDFVYKQLYLLFSYPKRHAAEQQRRSQRADLLRQTDSLQPKAGILTTYFAANYGAMLQPYALKRVLENEGLRTSMVRYKQPTVYASHKPISIEKLRGRNLGSLIGVLLAAPLAYLLDRKMQAFKRRFIEPSDSFETAIPTDYDYYFLGSDQIWNPRNTGGFDDAYFGYFPTKQGAKKIAYAASGEKKEYTQEDVAYLTSRLSQLDAIGVREQSLRNKLMQATGIKNIDVVLDPTLLATPDILSELPYKDPLPNQSYVLFYQIRDCLSFLPKILSYARSRNCKLLILSSTPKKDILVFALKHKDVVYRPIAGEEEFLGAMRYAQAVFTPSFHGSVFAILNHRPLFSMMLGDGADSRAHDLLCSLHVDYRLVDLDTNLQSLPETNYEEVDAHLHNLRMHSMNFIRKHLRP